MATKVRFRRGRENRARENSGGENSHRAGAAIPERRDDAVPIQYVADLLSETREELKRADSKASLIFAAVGVVLGTLVSAAVSVRWSPLRLAPGAQWLWWLGVAAAVYGMLSIAASVHPNSRPRVLSAGPPTYFGEVAAYPSIEQFLRAARQVTSPLDRMAVQAFVLSRVVRRKYVLLRYGMWALLAGAVACTAAIAVSGLLAR